MAVHRRVVVVGGGHNGLVAGCYLARAGAEVTVLEQADKLGGGSRTDELAPGFRFNTHSAAHNIINATDIMADLPLAEAGLEYREMDPFSVAVFAAGTIVRFHRSVERTVASIAEVDPVEARCYAAWMRDAMPIITALRAGLDTGEPARRWLPRTSCAPPAGHLPDDPVPTYAFTPSTLDDTLAPPGHHTVYLACPTAPSYVRGGWPAVADAFADRMIETVQARVPGFTDTIVHRVVRTPDLMARELRWPRAHPMHLDTGVGRPGTAACPVALRLGSGRSEP